MTGTLGQGEFTAPCRCMWLGDQLEVPCAAWRTVAAVRDRLRRDWPAERVELRSIERDLARHMPSEMADEPP